MQVFAEAPAALAPVLNAKPLYAAIGRLQMKNALLKKRWGHVSNAVTGPVSGDGPGRRLGDCCVSDLGPVTQHFEVVHLGWTV